MKTTIDLEPQVAEALRQLAKLRGRSEQELIHEALAVYTGVMARPMPKGAGKFSSGRSDASEPPSWLPPARNPQSPRGAP